MHECAEYLGITIFENISVRIHNLSVDPLLQCGNSACHPPCVITEMNHDTGLNFLRSLNKILRKTNEYGVAIVKTRQYK